MVGGERLVSRVRALANNVGPARTTAIPSWLPPLHQEVLRSLNGFTVQRGSLRMFGIGREDALDLD